MSAPMSSKDEEYVCTLSAASLEKAQKELSEDAKNRLGAVQTLRSWIEQQPHMICPTETELLLRYLRYCKFSQLVARERFGKWLESMVKYPEWVCNIDTCDKKIIKTLKSGCIIPLPGTDKDGCKILLIDYGAMDPSLKGKEKDDSMKAFLAIFHHLCRDENILVNGFIEVNDMTGMTFKHQTMWSLDDMKKSMQIFLHAFPARLKSFHYYNMGAFGEGMLNMFMPFMPKKWKDRIILHGDNMESVYKVTGMERLPEEYLPDDYTGKHAGTKQQLIDSLVSEMQQPEVRAYIKHITNPRVYSMDLKKKPKPQEEEPQASFRKLNVD